MRLLVAAALAGLIALGWSAPAGAQVWSPDKSSITDFYGTAAVTPLNGKPAFTPSIAIAVSINGGKVYSKGYGHVAPGGPLATGDTVYHIGSLSKQFLAATLVGLIENTSGPLLPGGKSKPGALIALDDPIEKFVPDFGLTHTGPVTLRDMLNMHSGYASYTSPPTNVSMPFPSTQPVLPREMLRYVLSFLAKNPSPGGALSPYFYSNTNYFLIANAIEFFQGKQLGVPNYNYQTLVRSQIFQKAGLVHTGFLGEAFPGALVAPAPYDITNAPYANPAWPKGAGEIASTANDLIKWHAALMTDDLLVSALGRKQLFKGTGSAGYAMGWMTVSGGGYNWYSHGGNIPGYTAFDGIFQNMATGQWVSVAILTNNDNVPNLPGLGACLAQLAMDPSKTKAGLGPIAKKACAIPG